MAISVKRASFDFYRIVVERDELLMFCLVGSRLFGGAISVSLQKLRDAVIEGEGSFRSIESAVQVPPVLIIREFEDAYEIVISRPLFRDIVHGARNALAADGYSENGVQVSSRRARNFATKLRDGYIESEPILNWSSETGVTEFYSGGGVGLQDVVLRVDSVGFDLLCAIIGHYHHQVDHGAGRMVRHSGDIEAIMRGVASLRENLLELSIRRAFAINSRNGDEFPTYQVRPIELELSLSLAQAGEIINAVERTVRSTAPSEFNAFFGYSQMTVQEFSNALMGAAERAWLRPLDQTLVLSSIDPFA
jgi:hypothetical protein